MILFLLSSFHFFFLILDCICSLLLTCPTTTGFVHSAFTFAYESMLGRSSTSKVSVPPGALITFLQKGLQYVGIEETLQLKMEVPKECVP
jgi:hypothetical protein